jgi:hypothetical protein
MLEKSLSPQLFDLIQTVLGMLENRPLKLKTGVLVVSN